MKQRLVTRDSSDIDNCRLLGWPKNIFRIFGSVWLLFLTSLLYHLPQVSSVNTTQHSCIHLTSLKRGLELPRKTRLTPPVLVSHLSVDY